MKFQLFSLSLLTHISLSLSFFASSDLCILPQFYDSQTTTSTLKDNETINQVCVILLNFPFSGNVLNRLELLIWGEGVNLCVLVRCIRNGLNGAFGLTTVIL